MTIICATTIIIKIVIILTVAPDRYDEARGKAAGKQLGASMSA